jgi:hypothetical protein
MNNAQLEARLESLERRVNRYRGISVLLALALVGLAGIAANAPQGPVQPEVRTHKLVIIDQAGRETAHLTSGPHGGLLSILTTNGIPVARLGAGEKGGKFAMMDAKGDPSIMASSEEATGGELVLQDKKGGKNLLRATK